MSVLQRWLFKYLAKKQTPSVTQKTTIKTPRYQCEEMLLLFLGSRNEHQYKPEIGQTIQIESLNLSLPIYKEKISEFIQVFNQQKFLRPEQCLVSTRVMTVDQLFHHPEGYYIPFESIYSFLELAYQLCSITADNDQVEYGAGEHHRRLLQPFYHSLYQITHGLARCV